MDTATRAEILELERSLIAPETRHVPGWLDRVLAMEMVEFGKSGRVFTRNDIIASLAAERPATMQQYELASPECIELSADSVLVTYRLEPLVQGNGELLVASLRSSIWCRRDDRWQMLFHQGTVAAP